MNMFGPCSSEVWLGIGIFFLLQVLVIVLILVLLFFYNRRRHRLAEAILDRQQFFYNSIQMTEL